MKIIRESNWFVGHFRRATIKDIRARRPMLMINLGCFDPAVNPFKLGILIKPVRNPIQRGRVCFQLLSPTSGKFRPWGRQGFLLLTMVTGNGQKLLPLEFWVWDNANALNSTYRTLDEVASRVFYLVNKSKKLLPLIKAN